MSSTWWGGGDGDGDGDCKVDVQGMEMLSATMAHVKVEKSVDRAEIKHRSPEGLDQNGTWSRMLEHESSKR